MSKVGMSLVIRNAPKRSGISQTEENEAGNEERKRWTEQRDKEGSKTERQRKWRKARLEGPVVCALASSFFVHALTEGCATAVVPALPGWDPTR
jgi:hypothetical protein